MHGKTLRQATSGSCAGLIADLFDDGQTASVVKLNSTRITGGLP
jgi:hypothetical protein